jgi:CubicO group peptidase (beta-lactamase class C family)
MKKRSQALSRGGFSKVRLKRLHEVMTGYTDRGEVPGMVTLVSRGKDLFVDSFGKKSMDREDAVKRDTLFRITSMTKPITAAATMILVEECKLRLDDPVESWLPELANRRVLKRLSGPLEETVPANRSITVRDLLTFRMGFGIIMEPSSDYPIQNAMNELQIREGEPKPRTPHGPDEWMKRLGSLPLMDQPGGAFFYNTSYHVLGVLIARVAGMPLERFLRERIFDPLEMEDTGFHVPASQLKRLISCYWFDSENGKLELHDDQKNSQWKDPPEFPDAAAGLISTVDDYYAFAQMMLNLGKRGRTRVLSRASVETMTSGQLLNEPKSFDDFFPNRELGFGVAKIIRRDDIASSPGRYSWDGGYGTSWSIDPREGLIGIHLTQRTWDSPALPKVSHDFWTLVYQALED